MRQSSPAIASPATAMSRIYLYVSPEEYAEVEASGASWDDTSKSWYIEQEARASFARWLGDIPDEGFSLTSDEALVAAAMVPCAQCRELIEVICIYCRSGVDEEVGAQMTDFTVSSVWAMDEALNKQLQRWPQYRKTGESSDQGVFANHCANCGAVQEDYWLHAEPEDVFFGIAPDTGHVAFTPLEGTVRLSGDYGFEV